MRRTLALLPLVLLGLAPAAAAQHETAGDEPPPLKASLAACSTGALPDQRFALFTGSMPAYRGTRRMAMRFDLYTRPIGARRWERVRGRKLSRWQRSDPDRAGFVYTKRVERLLPDHEYRAAVRFRWQQSGGARRPDRVRRTPVCRQPDQRPNLRITSVTVHPGADAGSRRYVVEVLNNGMTAAGPFDVGLVAARDDVRTVPGLPAGERATVEIAAPACPFGERVLARADVRDAVDESSERDNRFIGACDGR